LAITLGSIVVELLANTGGFITGMNKASYEAKKSAKDIKESLSGMGDAAESLLAPFGEIGAKLGAAFGGIGQTLSSVSGSLGGLSSSFGAVGLAAGVAVGAIAAVGVAGAGIALSAAKAANEMFELSEKTGVSVESLSRFGYAAGLNGVNTESLGKSLEKLNKSIFAAASAPAGAVNAFTRLGVAVKDSEGNLRSSEDVLLDLTDKFKSLPEGPARGALAMQLFGKAGAEMLPFLIQGKAGIQALAQEADKLGVTIGGKTAEGSHVFEQTLQRMQGALTGASNTVLKEMLPSMQAFADFILSDLKDPSGVFRSIGRVILDVVVPAFKILSGVVGTLIAAGDVVTSVFSHGLDFIATQVYTLANAFSTLKNGGSFKQAGAELKEGFKRGLDDFTKGVTEDTDKANQRLQTLYGKLIFGADDTDQSKKPAHSDGGGRVDQADKSNPIADRIAKLNEAASAEEKLAASTNLSTAAIRVQNEANEANKVILELQQIALKKHLDFTNADKDAVRLAVVAAGEFKAAFDVRNEIQKQTLALGLNTDKVNSLAAAYLQGGDAILDAEAKIAAIPLQEKVNELSASITENTAKFGQNSDKVKALAVDLKAAQSELENFIQTAKRSKEADAAQALAQNFHQLQSSIAGLKITGDAIGGTTEQLRQAQVQAQLTQYELTHIGVDKHSAEWIAYAAAVEEASKQTEDNRLKNEALKYDLENTFKNAMTQLEQYRQVLVKMGTDTTAIDAAIIQENQKLEKSYAQNLLTVGGFANGAKAFFIEFTNDGKNAATAINDALKVAFDGLGTQLTNLIVKGKADFKGLLQSIETSIVGSAVHSLEQTAVKGLSTLIPGLGGLLGGGQKPDGTRGNPLHVINVGSLGAAGSAGGAGGGIGSFLSQIPVVGKLFSGLGIGGGQAGLAPPDGTQNNPFYVMDASGGGGLFGGGDSSGDGGGGNIFSTLLGSIFGGGKAGGGDVSPGKAYLVGEKRPELFVPRSAGTIVPSVSSGSNIQNITHQTFNIQTADADSFKKSQSQISSAMGNAASRGQMRNGR
jgi:lambda family phage tail tape measure protein